jgi:hypothetical protein
MKWNQDDNLNHMSLNLTMTMTLCRCVMNRLDQQTKRSQQLQAALRNQQKQAKTILEGGLFVLSHLTLVTLCLHL